MTDTVLVAAGHGPAMTSRASHVPDAGSGWHLASDAAVLLLLAYWATVLTWGAGGRDPHLLSYGAALLLVASLLVKPWRALPVTATALAGGLGLGAVVVCVTAPTGWAGAAVSASYVVAGQAFLVIAAWARDRARATAVLAMIVAAGGLQLGKGWLAWWGGEDPLQPFQGTFYWHNQVGIFLVAGALAAAGVAAWGMRPYAPLGWVVAPLAAAGTIFTTSRGSQIGLALGWLLLLACAGAVRRWGVALRLLAIGGLAYFTSWALAGPPFFSERVAATAGTAARAESFTGNGVMRFEHWLRACQIFLERPFSGAGFNSFGDATALATGRPEDSVTSLAHNGFLQAAADGGLVLALPLWVASVLVLLRVARRFPVALKVEPTRGVASLVLLVLVLHSGMDFDWSYPSLLILVACVGAVAWGPSDALVRTPTWLPTAAAAAAVVLLVYAAVAGWGGSLDLNAAVRSL